MASFNFVEPYLRTVFGFLGVTDMTFISAGGTMAVNYGKVDRESYLQPHIDSIERQLVVASVRRAAKSGDRQRACRREKTGYRYPQASSSDTEAGK